MSSAPAHASKYLTSADGTAIYAEGFGNHANPSIVFLHGFALSGVVFDRLFDNQKLLDQFYLVRYDMRGHGRSGKPSKPSSHTSALYAADFATVVEGMALIKPVFVGWSVGAAVITDICANIKPLPISGAVALSGCPGIDKDIVKVIANPFLLDLLAKFNSNDNVTDALAARVAFVEAMFHKPEKLSFQAKCRYLGQTVLEAPDICSCVSFREQDPSHLFEAGRQGLPLQLLWGLQDKFGSGDPVLELMKPYFKDITVSFVEGGHAVFEDNADGVAGELCRFVLNLQQRK